MQNNLGAIISVLIFLVVACSCLGNGNGDKPQSFSTQPAANVSPATNKKALDNAPAALKDSSTKTAEVIEENAALRQTPGGKVLQSVPVASNVEVIRQKGAWFYVVYGDRKGWMHGNTIRYLRESDDSPQRLPAPDSVTKSAPVKSREPASSERVSPTGATAQCRDGSLSYSAHRRGTCSHHGGVAVWF